MFKSKDHCLGGTDAIFEQKVTMHEDMPSTVLRLTDSIGKKIPYEVRFKQLTMFDHYMSSGLVILKDKSYHTREHEAFLAQFRTWLSVVPLKAQEVWDYNERQMVVQKMCFYVENEEYMMIPLPIAVTLFGPSVYLPFVAERPKEVYEDLSFGLKHDSATLSFPIVNWHKVPGVTTMDNPHLKAIVDRNRAAYLKLTANDNAKKRKRVKIDHFQPHVPETTLLPAPCQLMLLRRDEELLNSGLGFKMPDESQLTQPLRYVGRLRENPVDQLPIVAAGVLHIRRSLMSIGTLEESKKMTIAQIMECLFCGAGKTQMGLCQWAWLLDDRFDHLTIADLENQNFCTNPDNERLRTQKEPRRTLRCLFIVHNIALMEQAAEDIAACLPDARIGMLQREKRPNPLECDIVVASTDTISVQDFDPSYFDHFGYVIGDEAHQNKALMFNRAFRKPTSLYKAAFTATPRLWILPAFQGAVLVYVEPPYIPRTSNMIVYWAGDRIHRSIKSGGSSNGEKKAERVDITTQASDLVMDMRRNMWLVFITLSTCVIGRLPTHVAFPEHLYVTLKDPLQSGKRTVLIQGRTFSSVMKKDSTNDDDEEDEDATAGPSKPGASKAKKKKQQSYVIEPEMGDITDFFKPVASSSSSKPTASSKPTSSVASSSSVAQPSSKVVASSTKAKKTKAANTKASDAKQYQTKIVNQVVVPFEPTRNKRNPIIFSTSIAHLIMHQHWQAQYWIDTCTSIPRENLILVRTNMRQLAVLDKTKLTPAQLERLVWLGPNGFNMSSYSPTTKVAVGVEEDFLKTKYGQEAPSNTPRVFDAHFWRDWFVQFPLNETQADEDEVEALNKSNKKRFKKVAAAASKESKAMNNVNQSVASKLQQSIAAGMKKVAATNAASASTAPSSSSSMLVDEPPMPITNGKKAPKKTKATAAITPKPSAAAEFENDCLPQSHLSSQWMHRCSYFWTPIYSPMPDVWKPRTGLWAREQFLNDLRGDLPVLATFGLLVGRTYPVPKPMKQKIRQAHLKDALACDFVFATYQIASVGLNKPPLDTCIQALTNRDDEQSDGRCAREIPNKQEFVKNEFVEPWSIYESIAYKHHRAYRHQKRFINYYRIEFEQ